MSDSTLNSFVAQGTDAERIAFTPVPPTPAVGPDSGYYFFVNDTTPKKLYAWDSGTSAWVLISSGGAGTIPTTAQGDLLYASASNTLAALAKNTSATRYLSNTGGSNNPAWAQVALATGVSGLLPQANGGFGVAPSITTLTDAEIKALPTTKKTLIAAPGAGFRIRVLACSMVSSFAAGVYTNINATYSDLHSTTNYVLYGPANDSTTTPALTQMTDFLGSTTRRIYDVMMPDSLATKTSTNFNYVLASLDDRVNQENVALELEADNNGSGNFTGGNAANTLKVTVYYVVEAV